MASSFFQAKLSPSHRPALPGTSINQVWLFPEATQEEEAKPNRSSRSTLASNFVSSVWWQTKPHTLKADGLLEDIRHSRCRKINHSSSGCGPRHRTSHSNCHAQSHGSLILQGDSHQAFFRL